MVIKSVYHRVGEYFTDKKHQRRHIGLHWLTIQSHWVCNPGRSGSLSVYKYTQDQNDTPGAAASNVIKRQTKLGEYKLLNPGGDVAI